jgi:hypothetical protein
MKTTRPLVLISALFAVVNGAQAQTATTTPAAAPAPTVSKDCKGLKPQAQQECLKVAKKMEHDAAAPHDANTTPEPSGPSADTVHHSSPVMQTPEEKKAASKATRAGHDTSKTAPSPDPAATPTSTPK